MREVAVHENVRNELMRFKIRRQMVMKSQMIIKVNSPCGKNELGNEKDDVYNDDVFCHHRQMTKTTGAVLIIKVHLFSEEFFDFMMVNIHHDYFSISGI